MLSKLVKKKFNYYLSRSEYYNSVITENSFIKTISSDINISSDHTRYTDQPIFFNNKLQLNSNYEEIVEKLGEPSYKLYKSKSKRQLVLFYKKIIGTIRSRFELHLVDDRLIIGFLTFDVFSMSRKLKVVNAIVEKYGIGLSDIDINKLKITDSNNHYIKIIDSVHLTLAYGINTKQINQLIFDMANEHEIAKLSEIQRETNDILNNI